MIIPDDLLQEAGRLADADGPSETTARAAISRAYYGLFHAARQCAENRGYAHDRDANGGTHQQLRDFLHRAARHEPALYAVARMLKRLHEQRVRADYHLSDTIYPEDARRVIDRARTTAAVVPAQSAS